MNSNKKQSDATAPSLKYHRHGTWDMIDVPIAIRSTVGRFDADRSRMPPRPSASQLLFNPKTPARHPAISEVCSKFESFSRGGSRNFGKRQPSKSREWKRSANPTVLEASADMQGNDAMNHQADVIDSDETQLPLAAVHDPKADHVDMGADHVDMGLESEISHERDQVSSLEPTSGYQDVIEPLQATASVDFSVSDVFRSQQADYSDGSSCSSSDQDSLPSETAINRDLSRESSVQESHSVANPIDIDLQQGADHTAVEEDTHSDGIPVDQADNLDGNDTALCSDSDIDQAQEDDLAEVDVDQNYHNSSDESHPEDDTASDYGPPSKDTSNSNNVLADGTASIPSLNLSPSICSRHEQQSSPTSSPISAPLSDRAVDRQESTPSPLHNANLANSRNKADHAQEAVEFDYHLAEASSEARATVRDISALFRLQEDAESSDSGSSNSSKSSSRGSHGHHVQHNAYIIEPDTQKPSEPDIQKPLRLQQSTVNLDDDLLNAAMRSLSLNFDSETDSPSDPAVINDRFDARSRTDLSVRFGGESVSTQPEPRLDMFEYPLIKHGRRGNRRRIYLTVDMGAGIIRWGNGRRWLQIEHILQVRSGKETPVLKRRTAEDVDGRLCLSLITRYRSLDLECKTVEERKAVQLTIMIQIIGYLRHHNVRAGWIRPGQQSS